MQNLFPATTDQKTFKTSGEAYKHLVRPVSTKYGAPMGRIDVGQVNDISGRVFDRYISLNMGGYDSGGAYWGTGALLRVRYTLDLAYVRYYRETWEYEIQGFYSKEYGYECVTTETTVLAAREQLACYRENEPGVSFRIKKVRVLPS